MQQRQISSDPLETNPTAFYERLDDGRFAPSRATESPWSTRAQHGGPPLALAAFALEETFASTTLRFNRITLDFLGEIPREPLAANCAIVRPGKRVELLTAELAHAARPVALVRLWRSRLEPATTDIVTAVERPAPIPPEQPQRSFHGISDWGYAHAVEWRFVHGGFDQSGRASAWMRPRLPLVAGRALDPLCAVLIVADSANGISSPLRLDEWLFVPVSISVSFLRDPTGEWFNLTAQTTLGADGRGVTTAWLFDLDGPVAQITQSLFVARR